MLKSEILTAKKRGEYVKTGHEIKVEDKHATFEIRKVTKKIKITGEIVERDYIVYKTGVTNATIEQICKSYRVT